MYNIPELILSYNWKCVPLIILSIFSQSPSTPWPWQPPICCLFLWAGFFVCFYLLSFGCAGSLLGAHSLPAVPGGEGYSLVAVPWLLIGTSLLCRSTGSQGTKGSERCGSQRPSNESSKVMVHRLSCPWRVGSSGPRMEPMSAALADRFLTLDYQKSKLGFQIQHISEMIQHLSFSDLLCLA